MRTNLELSYNEKRILGERIKKARKSSNYIQNDVIELLGCSLGHLSAIENGHVIPNGRELVFFCKLYGKSMSYFFEHLIQEETPENICCSEKNVMSCLGLLTEKDIKNAIKFLDCLSKELNDLLAKYKK